MKREGKKSMEGDGSNSHQQGPGYAAPEGPARYAPICPDVGSSSGIVPGRPGEMNEAESGNHDIIINEEEGELKHDEENQFLMPAINIARIMRNAIPGYGIIVSEEAVEAVQQCVSEYISFITSEANANCQFDNRKILASEDILRAFTKLGFHHYAAPLNLFLHRYRQYESDRKSSLYGHSFVRRRQRQIFSIWPPPPPPPPPVYFNPLVPYAAVPPPDGRYFAAPATNNYAYYPATGASPAAYPPPPPLNGPYGAPPRGINYGPSFIASGNSFGGVNATPYLTAPGAGGHSFDPRGNFVMRP